MQIMDGDANALDDLDPAWFDPQDEERPIGYSHGVVGVHGTTATPSQTTPAAFLESLDWGNDDGLMREESEFVSAGRKKSHIRNESNPINAVHMHVQDNARIPNYNHAVDRSNSNSAVKRSSETSVPVARENENSLAEHFLNYESKYRKSLSQQYKANLALEDSDFRREIEELAVVSVDPTPWSEIARMQVEEKDQQRQRPQTHFQQVPPQEAQRPVTTSSPTPESSVPVLAPAGVPELVSPSHPHTSSYYPYGRHHQLPIPERASSPQGKEITSPLDNNNTAGERVDGMAQAIATAAAIVAGSNVTAPTETNATEVERVIEPTPTKSAAPAVNNISGINSFSPTAGLPKRTNQPITKSNGQSTTKGTPIQNRSTLKTGGDLRTLPNGHLQRQRSNANPPPHAAAHTVRRASVLAATNRKSQYGFGGNHTVPSVPAPPTIRSASKPINGRKPKQIAAMKKAPSATASSITKAQNPIPRLPPPPVPNCRHPTMPIVNNACSAYERKKQKAKDARVKLNESIERLSIAVSLAGSQSRSRIEQLENEIIVTEFRQKSIQVNEEGIKLAENAKKWDRPSFVGTAASVIQSLNAQCEALMAELGAMQSFLDAAQNGNRCTSKNGDFKNPSEVSVNPNSSNIDSVPTNTANFKDSSPSTDGIQMPIPNQKHKRQDIHVGVEQNHQSPIKRPRIDFQETKNSAEKEKIIYGHVAKMLDPVSLCNCVCVSKHWRGMQVFQAHDHWLDLAVNRFGFSNVRQWSEDLDDEEHKMSKKSLYMKMNASNVMPHFSQEGLTFLGSGKIPGKISGWAFLVERSNGETLRSVKRDPKSGVSGGGTYQSRPVVELRIVVQNIGMARQPIVLKSQSIGVDVSTRRRGGEFNEIGWDDRFKKIVRNMDGTIRPKVQSPSNVFHDDLCSLRLFESIALEVHIDARGCSTTSKFQQRSNFTKILVSLDGTTVPMVIPFLKHV